MVTVQDLSYPEYYVLQGDKIHIIYQTKAVTLNCQYTDNSQNFSGLDIRKINTDLGEQLSVTLKKPPHPDVKGQLLILNLLLPEVEGIGEGKKKEWNINTLVIISTTELSGNMHPEPGQEQKQTYNVIPVTGKARWGYTATHDEP